MREKFAFPGNLFLQPFKFLPRRPRKSSTFQAHVFFVLIQQTRPPFSLASLSSRNQENLTGGNWGAAVFWWTAKMRSSLYQISGFPSNFRAKSWGFHWPRFFSRWNNKEATRDSLAPKETLRLYTDLSAPRHLSLWRSFRKICASKRTFSRTSQEAVLFHRVLSLLDKCGWFLGPVTFSLAFGVPLRVRQKTAFCNHVMNTEMSGGRIPNKHDAYLNEQLTCSFRNGRITG